MIWGRYLTILLFLFIIFPLKAQGSRVKCNSFNTDDFQAATIEPDSLLWQARCWYDRGNTSEAKKYLKFLNRQDSTFIPSGILLARIYDNEYNYVAAIRAYKRIISIDSTTGVYYRNYADLMKATGLYKEALTAYKKAVQKNKYDLRSHISIAELSVQLKKYEAAEKHVNLILGLDKSHLRALQLSQLIAFVNDDWNKVIELRNKMEEIAPLTSSVKRRTAYAYMSVDSFSHAIHILENIRNKQYASIISLYMARCLENIGKYKKAKFFYGQAIDKSISPRLPFHMESCAAFLERRKDYMNAYDAYKRVYNLTSDVKYLFDLGRICEYAFADKGMALRYYRKYIEEGGVKDRELAEMRISYINSYREGEKSGNSDE